MANVLALQTMRNLAAQLPDGVQQAWDSVSRFLSPDLVASDSLAWYAYASISTTKQEISDNAGARPIVVIARSNGTLGYVHFHDLDADSVTEGVDANFVVPVAATANELTVVICAGASWARFWDVGLTVSSSTTVEASAAMTNPPDLWVLYHTG